MNTRLCRKPRKNIGSFGEQMYVRIWRAQNFSRHRNFQLKVAVSDGGVGMQEKTTSEDYAVGSVKITDISAITVNSATLEKIIGVKDRRIRQLAEQGTVVRAAKGRYRLLDSVMNYILTLKVAAEAAGVESQEGELDLEEEKALHERVKRHISELKLQTMQGNLHKSEDVERVMTDMLVSVKARLLSMPTKLAPLLVSRSDADYIRTVINREVLEALNELKDYDPKDFRSDDFVADDDTEDYESPE